MAYALKSRERQIPNGFRFLQPETNWQPTRFASFNSIVNSLISHRRSNPHLVAQNRWSLDLGEVAQEVDRFNANLCAQHGWTDYITDGGAGEYFPPPKIRALPQSEKNAIAAAAGKAKKIWSGIRTLNDWIDSGAPPVPSGQSAARAATCAVCKNNTAGDFTSWFTSPAAAVIAKQVARVADRKLTTPDDARINICGICLCPLKLKVHTPLSYINTHLSEDVLRNLKTADDQEPQGCWIIKERGQ